MPETLQNVLVWTVIAAAVSYLAWRSWRNSASNCGGCGSAGADDRAPKAKPFVPIDSLEKPFSPGRQTGKEKEKP